MTRLFLTAIAVALPLAGCNGPATVAPARTASSDAMNQMDMPDGSPVDMTSVPFYPGAKMVDVKIMPHEPADAMTMNFDAPAAPSVVRDWYVTELGAKGFKLSPDGNGLAGTTPAGGLIHIKLDAAPGGHTLGAIVKG